MLCTSWPSVVMGTSWLQVGGGASVRRGEVSERKGRGRRSPWKERFPCGARS